LGRLTGKFANGAVTAAMAYAFSQCASGGCSRAGGDLEDRTFRSERAALRYIQRNVDQPELLVDGEMLTLEDGGFIFQEGRRFRVSRMIGGPQGIDLGPPPDGAVAAWHRHPDLGPGSEYFSLAFRSGSRADGRVGPYYDYHQGDVAYSHRHDIRFYLIAPGSSLRMINPQHIQVEYYGGWRTPDEARRLRWKVQ